MINDNKLNDIQIHTKRSKSELISKTICGTVTRYTVFSLYRG